MSLSRDAHRRRQLRLDEIQLTPVAEQLKRERDALRLGIARASRVRSFEKQLEVATLKRRFNAVQADLQTTLARLGGIRRELAE